MARDRQRDVRQVQADDLPLAGAQAMAIGGQQRGRGEEGGCDSQAGSTWLTGPLDVSGPVTNGQPAAAFTV